PAAKRVKLD
nr:Chain C, MYC PROTO-ONCOGENE PROTEIN [Homo sapiens]1EE4_D Chain D, MYC PROTO-ONCOGENE PROTEIN [Homo sapiens]1EE4_E Chain E, MYC PROTO-ONCOGENE PROTEIN [Homo sapiens]1EE4_F Chain F, MYC PROTO-ONCOGENE PROTEIN [Homo sapiens]